MYTAKQQSALKQLLKQKPHLVLGNKTKQNWTDQKNQNEESIKTPFPKDYQNKIPPRDIVKDHIAHGGLVGLIPKSISAVVFDYDPDRYPQSVMDDFIEEYGQPAFICNSRQLNGKHLYYRYSYNDDDDRFGGNWEGGEYKGSTGFVWLWHPEQIDLEALQNSKPIKYIKKIKERHTDAPISENAPSLEKMRDVLSKIDPDCDYDKWREVGMGLKNVFGDEGFMLWDEWSSQGKKYKGREMSQKWDTFSYDGELGVGTILYHTRPTECFDPAYIEALQIVEKEFSKETDYLEIICAADRVLKPIDWLVDGWFQVGALHILAGASSAGKSLISNWMAAAISKGEPFPCGTKTKIGATLIYNSSEETLDELVLPRIKHFGADMRKIFTTGNVKSIGGDAPFDPSNPKHLDHFDKSLAKHPDVSLVIIDPILDLLPPGDTYSAVHVRKSIYPFLQIIKKHGKSCIGILHPRKDGSGKLIDQVAGSGAWPQIARSTYMMKKITDTSSILCPLHEGRNLPNAPPSISFEWTAKIDTQRLNYVDLTWGESDDRFGEEVLSNVDGRSTRDAPKKESAESWIYKQLLLSGGMKWNNLLIEAKDIHSKSTLRDARDKMKEGGRIMFDKNRTSEWKLVDSEV